jgi:hypothetical protein
MKKQHVQLSPADRDYLESLIRQGEQIAKAYRRALALLELDRGKTYTEVSNMLRATIPTVSGWAAKYRENGLEVLQDQPRSGRPVEIDGTQRAKITALDVVRRQKGMPNGACGCWPIKLSNWNIANTSPTRRWDRCSKKRAEATSQTYLVYWNVGQSLSGTHGANSGALRLALRSTLSRSLL